MNSEEEVVTPKLRQDSLPLRDEDTKDLLGFHPWRQMRKNSKKVEKDEFE